MQGAMVSELSACPDFVTNGEYAHSPFTKNVPSFDEKETKNREKKKK